MKVRSLLIMLLAGIISSCSIPLGTPGQTQSATLSLAFDGPLTSSSARAADARLVTPDTNYVQLIVTDASGAVVQTAQQAWSPGSGVPSMKVALSKVPMGVPLTLTVKTVTSLTDPVVTGQGSTTMTLAAGANTARIAIVPTAEVNKTLVLGDSEELDLEAGNWVLWQLNFSGTQASQAAGASRAAPKETLSAFKLTLPEGLKAYLQSPSGNTIEVVTPGSISLPIEVGTWNLLLWNQDYEGSTFGISLSAAASADYGYTLRNVVLPYRPNDPSAPTKGKLILYNRGDDSFEGTTLLQFEMKADIAQTLNQAIGPQQALAIILTSPDDESQQALPVTLENAITSSGQSLDLYVYDIVDSNSALLASTKVRSAPANFGVSEDGQLSWAQSTDDNVYGYEIWAGNSSNSTMGQAIVTEVNAKTYLLPESDLLPPPNQTYNYRVRTVYTAANGMHYAGSYSTGTTFTNGAVVATPAPTVTIESPLGGTFSAGATVAVRGMSKNSSAPPRYEYAYNSGAGDAWSSNYQVSSYDAGKGTWSFDIPTTGIVGDWTVHVWGFDKNNSPGSVETTTFTTTSVETESGPPPSITIENWYVDGSGYFTGIVDAYYGVSNIEVLIDGTHLDYATFTDGTWEYYWDTSVWTESHDITFKVTDANNQSAYSDIVTVNLGGGMAPP